MKECVRSFRSSNNSNVVISATGRVESFNIYLASARCSDYKRERVIRKWLNEMQIKSTWRLSPRGPSDWCFTRLKANGEHLILSIFSRLPMRPTTWTNNVKESRDINHNSAIVCHGVKAVEIHSRATQLRIDFIRKKFSPTCDSQIDRETRAFQRLLALSHTSTAIVSTWTTSQRVIKTRFDLNSQTSRTVKQFYARKKESDGEVEKFNKINFEILLYVELYKSLNRSVLLKTHHDTSVHFCFKLINCLKVSA